MPCAIVSESAGHADIEGRPSSTTKFSGATSPLRVRGLGGGDVVRLDVGVMQASIPGLVWGGTDYPVG